MRGKKIILAMVSMLLVLTMLPAVCVSAEETGSIEITERATNISSKQVVGGVKLALYKVADVDSTEDVGYSITDAFSAVGVQAKDIVYAENLSGIAENLAKYAGDHSIEPEAIATTNSNGYLKFMGLSDGIYLVRQVNTEEDYEKLGYTYTTDPYIVAIPSLDSDGKKIRNVVCQPKGILKKWEKKDTSLTVYKVWKDNNDKAGVRPKTISVGLYKDNILEEKVDLDAGNNWMYTWNKLDPEYNWSVKEINVPDGYSTDVSSNDQIWTITNTYRPPTGKNVRTGDYTDIGKWMLLMAVAAAGIVIITQAKYKK